MSATTSTADHPAWCNMVDCTVGAEGYEPVHRGEPVIVRNEPEIIYVYLYQLPDDRPYVQIAHHGDDLTGPHWLDEPHCRLTHTLDEAATVSRAVRGLIATASGTTSAPGHIG